MMFTIYLSFIVGEIDDKLKIPEWQSKSECRRSERGKEETGTDPVRMVT